MVRFRPATSLEKRSMPGGPGRRSHAGQSFEKTLLPASVHRCDFQFRIAIFLEGVNQVPAIGRKGRIDAVAVGRHHETLVRAVGADREDRVPPFGKGGEGDPVARGRPGGRGGVAPRPGYAPLVRGAEILEDRKSTRLNSSHGYISYAV